MTNIKIALDWTPNINHIGFFVAQQKGFFQDRGLDVELLDPSSDNYQTTPAKKVELGMAHLALCPLESVISYRSKAKAFDLIALAAILQEDLSAIVVPKSDTVQSPKDLDGKSYASYKARYEDEIVRQMIRNDGGRGDIRIEYPAKLGIWNTIVNASCDATWIFLNWEGVEAAESHLDLCYFKMSNYGIPYSYSPVIAAQEQAVNQQADAYRKVLEATRQGYLYSQEHPEEATAILAPFVPQNDQNIDLTKALAACTNSFGTADGWGRMDRDNVAAFLHWLRDKQLETHPLTVQDLVSPLWKG
ncbi:MAG: ABC transporter substrate-binding protein [Bacteroidota bacterium]